MRTLLVLAGLLALVSGGLAAAAGPQEFQLPSGLKCVLLENHERPLVRLELITQWDPALEPSAGNGAAGFLFKVLETAGAGPYTRIVFNRRVDEMGLEFSFQGQVDRFRWSLVADSRSQETAFELLAHAVFRPVFEGPEIQEQRQLLVRKATVASPWEVAVDRFRMELGDPRVTSAGMALAKIELKDLQDLHKRLVRPEHASLGLYGDLSLAQAKQLAFLHLGVWGPGPAPASPPAPPRMAVETGFRVLMQAGLRAELWAGAKRPPEGLKPGIEALLAILLDQRSEAPAGPLEVEIFLVPRGPVLFHWVAAATNRDALVPSLVAALTRLRSQGVTPEGLERARLRWKAENTALALHPQRLLSQALQGDRTAEVEAVTLQELNAAVAAWLAPGNLHYLLLGADADLVKAAQNAGLGAPLLIQP